LTILSPLRQAFSRISKFFQGNSKEIPGFSKPFQGFANFFLGRFEGNQGVAGQSSRNRVFSNFRVASAATSGPTYAAERARDSPSREFRLSERNCRDRNCRRRFSGSGVGASAASHASTRKPTAATPAPCGFGGERRRGVGGSDRESLVPTVGSEIRQFVSRPRNSQFPLSTTDGANEDHIALNEVTV
jgi:hypothetical protein